MNYKSLSIYFSLLLPFLFGNCSELLSSPPPKPNIILFIADQDLRNIRDAGKLTAAQADVFIVPRPAEELYDCSKDPMQLVNMASIPAYQQELEALRQVLKQWRKETADTTPAELTKDWFDRETGVSLAGEKARGEMSGGTHTMRTTATGPF